MCKQTRKQTVASLKGEKAFDESVSGSPSQPQTELQSRRTRKVQFDTIEIRKYNKVLGDNPACRDGPPTQLDWEYSVLPSTSIDEYEEKRRPRRLRRHLALTSITRRNSMFYHFGYTHEEIDEAAEAIKKIQKQRQVTKKLKSNGKKERTQEVFENVTKTIKRTFSKEKLNYKQFESDQGIASARSSMKLDSRHSLSFDDTPQHILVR
jgi:hypothetical protein